MSLAEHGQKSAKLADQPLVQHPENSLQPTGHRWDHSSSWAVAQTMPVDSHSLEAVQLPSIQPIALQLSVHSIQLDADLGHSCAQIGAKTEFESSSGCALPCASIHAEVPFPLQSYRSLGNMPCQLNSVVSEVDLPWL